MPAESGTIAMSIVPPERNSPTNSRSLRSPSSLLSSENREFIPERSASISSSVSSARASKTGGSSSSVSGLRSLQRKLTGTGKVARQRESLEASINGGRTANAGVWSKFTGGRKSSIGNGRKEFALVQQRGNLDSILAISTPAESATSDAYEFLQSNKFRAPAFPSGPRLSPTKSNHDIPPPSPDFARQPSEPTLSSLRARNPHRHTPVIRRDSNILPAHLSQKPSTFQSTATKNGGTAPSSPTSMYSASPKQLAAPFDPLESYSASPILSPLALPAQNGSSRDVQLASGRLASSISSSIRSSQLQSSLNESYNKNRTSLIDSFGSGGQMASRAVGAAGLEGRKVALQKSAQNERTKNYWESPPAFPRLPFANDAPDLPPPSLVSRMRDENGGMQTRRMTSSPSPEPTHALPPLPTLPVITHSTSPSPLVAEFGFADDSSDATEEIEHDLAPPVITRRRSNTPGLPIIPARSSHRLSGHNFPNGSKSPSPVPSDTPRSADDIITFLPSLLPAGSASQDALPLIEVEGIPLEVEQTEEEGVSVVEDTGDSSESEISVREMQLEIIRMQEEISTPTTTSFPSPPTDEPSIDTAEDANRSISSLDGSAGKRWSIIEVELAYERMKAMLAASGKSTGVSESDVSEMGDAEGALERALRDSSLENYSSLPGLPLEHAHVDTVAFDEPTSPRLALSPSPTHSLEASPPPSPPHSIVTSIGTLDDQQDSSISSAASDSTDRLSVSSSSFTTSAITSRKVSEDSTVPLSFATKDNQQRELRDVFASSPSYEVSSDVPTSLDSSGGAQSEEGTLPGGRRRSSAFTAETAASEETFYSARTTRTVSRASMNLRSGVGREWRESQRASVAVEEGGSPSTTVSPTSLRSESSPRLARIRAGSPSNDRSTPVQPIWLTASSPSTSPTPQLSPRARRIGEAASAFDPSNFTMATIRGMDKLEIHFVIAGMKAGLDRTTWEKEGLVEALEESRLAARRLQKLVGLHNVDRLESLVQEREDWESQARRAQDELALSRQQESILRRSIVEGKGRELLLEARIGSMNRDLAMDVESTTGEGTIRKRIGTPNRMSIPISPTRQRYSTSVDLTLRHQTPPRIPLSLSSSPARSPVGYRSRTPLSYTHTRSASAASVLPSLQSFSPSNVISSARKRNGSISSYDEASTSGENDEGMLGGSGLPELVEGDEMQSARLS